MRLIPLKSERVKQNDDFYLVLAETLTSAQEKLEEGDILVIASKVLAYCEGRLEKITESNTFKEIVAREADLVLECTEYNEMDLTLKNRVLIPNAGIDKSNTPEGEVVLWPKDSFKSAREIQDKMKKEYGLKKLGILISDSHCHPLRMGTAGIAIGWAGFEGVEDVRGQDDLFGKKMLYTQNAVADNLSSAANLLMGETDASIPFVIVRGYDAVFTDKPASEEDYFVTPKECIYRGIYNERITSKT